MTFKESDSSYLPCLYFQSVDFVQDFGSLAFEGEEEVEGKCRIFTVCVQTPTCFILPLKFS